MFYCFYAFIFFLIGLISSIYSYYFLSLSILPFCYLYFYRKFKNKAFIFLIFLLFGFLIYFIYPKGNLDVTEFTGIVVNKSKNTYIILSIKGKYYVYDKNNNYNIFSILKLKGYTTDLSFSHYESGFDYKGYLISKGINYQFNIKSKEEIFINNFSFDNLFDFAYKFLDENGKLVAASFIKNDSLNSSSFYYLNDLGLNTYLSLSGFHLSFFLSFISIFIKNRNKKKFYSNFKIILISIFLFFSSFSYSFRRIFIQCVISFVIKNNKKLKDNINNVDKVSLTAFILLLFEPYSIMSSSFYYPFPFLFYLALFPSKIDSLKDKVLFSLKCIFFFLPYTFINKGIISFLSIIIQFIFIPYSHLLFLLSLLLLICPYIGYFYNILVKFLLIFSKWLYKYSITISVENYKLVFISIYYMLFIFASLLKTYNYIKIANIVLSFNMIPLTYYSVDYFAFKNEIIFIDVDQGDSTLLRYKGKNILFDTGGKTSTDLASQCLIPFFRKKNIKKLDYVFITHLDFDHYGALESLNTLFQIDNIIYGSDFLNFIDNSVMIDDLKITNLNKYSISNDTNDNSAVYYFECFSSKILIQGDAPKSVEELILKDNPNLKADIIKLGHHGSKTSSSKKYLQSLSIKLAIISVGEKNSYHLPSNETLITLKELNINYLRTDICSTITYKL